MQLTVCYAAAATGHYSTRLAHVAPSTRNPTLTQISNKEDVWGKLTNMKGSRLWSGQGKPRGGMGNEGGTIWCTYRESIHIFPCRPAGTTEVTRHYVILRYALSITTPFVVWRVEFFWRVLPRRSSETVVTTYPDYAHNDNLVRSMSTKSYTRNVC
jgi:hypothetical protein